MSSYRKHLYHIIFRTKDSLLTIRQDNVNELYAYITGISIRLHATRYKKKTGNIYERKLGGGHCTSP